MNKRFLSFLAAVCVTLALVPVPAARAASSTAGDSLTGLNRKIYDLVKA